MEHVNVIMRPDSVVDRPCDDCMLTRTWVCEMEPQRDAHGDNLLRVTVLAGCGTCEGSTVIL